ncbi:hypothetical protein H1R20_g8182, partial [Candolleomyces eurysporus]
MAETNQVEHTQISTSLEVERIDKNLFRSKSLWLPLRARGVFGGQVISQAVVSATNCVDPAFALHSLHCYFLLSASPATPIIYNVERVRDGKSYVTRAVKAVQNGRIIFIMICSFQKPEPWQPQQQWPMPKVPKPDDCELQEVRYARVLENKDISQDSKDFFQALHYERSRSPVAIKVAAEHDLSVDGVVRYMYWMRARSIPKYEAPFQKASPRFLRVGTCADWQNSASWPTHPTFSLAARTLGLRRDGNPGSRLTMTSTVDHTLWFYSNDFDFAEWLLYVIESPRAGSGRGVVHGRIYTQDGTLVAVAAQEGVVRADVRGPVAEEKKPAAKL